MDKDIFTLCGIYAQKGAFATAAASENNLHIVRKRVIFHFSTQGIYIFFTCHKYNFIKKACAFKRLHTADNGGFSAQFNQQLVPAHSCA